MGKIQPPWQQLDHTRINLPFNETFCLFHPSFALTATSLHGFKFCYLSARWGKNMLLHFTTDTKLSFPKLGEALSSNREKALVPMDLKMVRNSYRIIYI